MANTAFAATPHNGTAEYDGQRGNVLGVLVDPVDYETAVEKVLTAAANGQPLAVTALAVHGVMTGVADPIQRYRLNHLDLVVPDGQPVRWALNLLHGHRLKERVYGPELMLRLCERAEAIGLPIFLYGGSQTTVIRLAERLRSCYPRLVIAAAEPSKFRTTTAAEKQEIIGRICGSGARLVFVGLGCPRQEVFAYEYRAGLGIPIVAVGAAFPYHAGELREPNGWVQRHGLQWLVRLAQDPRRLWKRYLVLNPLYLLLLAAQALGIWRPRPGSGRAPSAEVLPG